MGIFLGIYGLASQHHDIASRRRVGLLTGCVRGRRDSRTDAFLLMKRLMLLHMLCIPLYETRITTSAAGRAPIVVGKRFRESAQNPTAVSADSELLESMESFKGKIPWEILLQSLHGMR